MKLLGIIYNKKITKLPSIGIFVFPMFGFGIHYLYEDEFGLEVCIGWLNFQFGWLFRISKKVKK